MCRFTPLGLVKTLSRRRVLVLGASSQVGVFAVPQLLTQGDQVLALGRQAMPGYFPDHPNLNWLNDTSQLGSEQPFDALLSAGPLNLVVRVFEQFPAVSHLAVTSTTSVFSKRDSVSKAEREQVQQIIAAESRLRALSTRTGASLVLLRPTLIYGCGQDSNLSLLMRFIQRFGFCPLSLGAQGKRQPLHAEDLATALVSGLGQATESSLESALCGGSVISYKEMVCALFTALGREPRLLALPPAVLATAVSAWARVSGSGLNAAMVMRQAQDLVFDDRQARHQLEVQPRCYKPTMKDFKLPVARA